MQKAKEATPAILATHCIPSTASEDLKWPDQPTRYIDVCCIIMWLEDNRKNTQRCVTKCILKVLLYSSKTFDYSIAIWGANAVLHRIEKMFLWVKLMKQISYKCIVYCNFDNILLREIPIYSENLLYKVTSCTKFNQCNTCKCKCRCKLNIRLISWSILVNIPCDSGFFSCIPSVAWRYLLSQYPTH